jgi:hypothetical protein
MRLVFLAAPQAMVLLPGVCYQIRSSLCMIYVGYSLF